MNQPYHGALWHAACRWVNGQGPAAKHDPSMKLVLVWKTYLRGMPHLATVLLAATVRRCSKNMPVHCTSHDSCHDAMECRLTHLLDCMVFADDYTVEVNQGTFLHKPQKDILQESSCGRLSSLPLPPSRELLSGFERCQSVLTLQYSSPQQSGDIPMPWSYPRPAHFIQSKTNCQSLCTSVNTAVKCRMLAKTTKA